MVDKQKIVHKIYREERKIDSSGTLIENKCVSIESDNIKDCERIFKENW